MLTMELWVVAVRWPDIPSILLERKVPDSERDEGIKHYRYSWASSHRGHLNIVDQ